MVSAKEAQRLTKTRWQAELDKIDKLVRKSICNNKYNVEYVGSLCDTTLDYIKNLGYKVIKGNNRIIIDWSCETE